MFLIPLQSYIWDEFNQGLAKVFFKYPYAVINIGHLTNAHICETSNLCPEIDWTVFPSIANLTSNRIVLHRWTIIFKFCARLNCDWIWLKVARRFQLSYWFSPELANFTLDEIELRNSTNIPGGRGDGYTQKVHTLLLLVTSVCLGTCRGEFVNHKLLVDPHTKSRYV